VKRLILLGTLLVGSVAAGPRIKWEMMKRGWLDYPSSDPTEDREDKTHLNAQGYAVIAAQINRQSPDLLVNAKLLARGR